MVVCGVASISRAVVNEEVAEDGGEGPNYTLLVEGYGLEAVMSQSQTAASLVDISLRSSRGGLISRK